MVEAAEKHLKVTVEVIWQRQGYDSDMNPAGVAGAREDQSGGAQTEKDREDAGNISMLGRRQVTPMWADDPV